MNKSAPQAYTKEVLATAFDWLSKQPQSIKEGIKNTDQLVGLFLKTTRLKEGGDGSDLSSAKSFRSELQGLALNLKQFEEKPEAQEQASDYLRELKLMMESQATSSAPSQVTQSFLPPQQTTQANVFSPLSHSANNNSLLPAVGSQQVMNSQTNLANSSLQTQHGHDPEAVLLKLDSKTKAAIEYAKERLNLSSNTEAIRVLVSLGQKHLHNVFGKE